jgi:hypothetical protein
VAGSSGSVCPECNGTVTITFLGGDKACIYDGTPLHLFIDLQTN